MEEFLKECGARRFGLIPFEDEDIESYTRSDKPYSFANSKTGMVFRIYRNELDPERSGRYRVQLGSIMGERLNWMNEVFCDRIKVAGQDFMTAVLYVGDRITGILSADFGIDAEADEMMYILSARYLDENNDRRIAVEKLDARRIKVRTGKLLGFNFFYFPMDPDEGYEVSVDFRNGRTMLYRHWGNDRVYKMLENEQLSELFDALKAERYCLDKEPDLFDSENHYSLELTYRKVKRTAVWSTGSCNEPSRFLDLIRKMMDEVPFPEE